MLNITFKKINNPIFLVVMGIYHNLLLDYQVRTYTINTDKQCYQSSIMHRR